MQICLFTICFSQSANNPPHWYPTTNISSIVYSIQYSNISFFFAKRDFPFLFTLNIRQLHLFANYKVQLTVKQFDFGNMNSFFLILRCPYDFYCHLVQQVCWPIITTTASTMNLNNHKHFNCSKDLQVTTETCIHRYEYICMINTYVRWAKE